MTLRHISPALLLLASTACTSESEEGPGGVSASEARALEDAAAMLDAQAGTPPLQGGSANPAAAVATRADRNRIEVKNSSQ